MGVDGFRCDVINCISKDFSQSYAGGMGPSLHEYLHQLNREAFAPHDAMTVGETWGLTPENSLLFTNPNRQELTMTFAFDHMLCGQANSNKFKKSEFDPKEYVERLVNWQYGLAGNGWNTLVNENHDMPRSVSRFGNETTYVKESAKMLATLVYCMRGTPFIFQGQELGLTNPHFGDISEYRDVETINAYNELKNKYDNGEVLKMLNFGSRDNARVPMPWSISENAGFTDGTPWIKSDNYPEFMNAEQEKNDSDSVFNYYKKLIKLKKSNDCIIYGDFKLISNENNIFVYERNYEGKKIIVLCNFCDKSQSAKNSLGSNSSSILLNNYPDAKMGKSIDFRPYEAIVFQA